MLLLDILSNTAVVYRYAGWVFGVEQGKPLETIEQVRARPDWRSAARFFPIRGPMLLVHVSKEMNSATESPNLLTQPACPSSHG